MHEQLQALLDSLATRNRKSRWGIGTAHTYLSDMIGCLTGGACPAKLFDLTSEAQWAEFIEKSKSQLTFCDDELVIESTKDATLDELAANVTAMMKTPKGTILRFGHVITTTRKDRDGDVLESKGAIVDPRMPLLWQHISAEPIGKFLGETKHTSDMVSGISVILDTELGRDAAVLVEGEALRISHGFDPKKFEPLKDKDAGWHIKEFEIQEVSLVSVPSNIDAVITNWDHGKLHHPIVKGWAKREFDNRPPISGWRKEVDPKLSMKVDFESGQVEITGAAEKPVDEKACTCGAEDKAKQLKAIAESGALTINQMREALGLPPAKANEATTRAEMLAEHTEQPAKGAAEQINDAIEKAGRALSGKHEKCLKDACSHMKCAMGHLKDMDDDMSLACHTMVSKAHDLTQQVLSGNQKPTDPVNPADPNGEEADYERSVESIAADFTAEVLKDGADLDKLDKLVKRISSVIESARLVREDEQLTDELAALV